jgi:dTDP-4-amino-4,6-dideoxygalactose transaminase
VDVNGADDDPRAEQRPVSLSVQQQIPLVDLRASYEALRDELDPAIAEVLSSTAFIMGPQVRQFEAAFADYCGTDWCVGVGSGTAALHLSLLALGVGPGDVVATVPHTFAATVEAIEQAGARVRFVDVDPDTGCMSPKALAAAMDEVDVVVPVHLYGQPADLDGIMSVLPDGRRVPLLEDAAQAHGATLPGPGGRPVRAGSVGDLGIFSFYPAKNLGAFGDAGAVVTSDELLAERVARLRDHGRAPGAKYEHAESGFGERLDTLQAAVLLVKLGHLDDGNAARAAIADRYDELLSGVGDLRLPVRVPERPSAWHQYVVRTGERDALLTHLHEAGIGAGVHYPLPLHLQPAWRRLGHALGDFPAAEEWGATCLSLPIYPELTEDQQRLVAEAVRDFYEGGP